MKIDLIKGYFIEIDELNYTLKKRYSGQYKDGKPKDSVKTIGYYSSVKDCLERVQSLIQLDIAPQEQITMDGYFEIVEKASKVMESVIQMVNV